MPICSGQRPSGARMRRCRGAVRAARKALLPGRVEEELQELGGHGERRRRLPGQNGDGMFELRARHSQVHQLRLGGSNCVRPAPHPRPKLPRLYNGSASASDIPGTLHGALEQVFVAIGAVQLKSVLGELRLVGQTGIFGQCEVRLGGILAGFTLRRIEPQMSGPTRRSPENHIQSPNLLLISCRTTCRRPAMRGDGPPLSIGKRAARAIPTASRASRYCASGYQHVLV